MFESLWKKQNIQTRSISGENRTGEPGKGAMAEDGSTAYAARELGKGWKVDPFMYMEPQQENVIADIEGPGMIKHIWIAPFDITAHREFVMRFYWDNDPEPAVEATVGDLFASSDLDYWQINSLVICRNPLTGYNSYFEMPFKKHCKVTIENLRSERVLLGFQIDYELREIPEDALYFHAQYFRSNPAPYKVEYPILDAIEGKGCFVGVSLVMGITNNNWWGEGEVKFFIDDDDEYPTICGTGTEDYFCASFDFEVNKKYTDFSSPYTGFHHWKTDDLYSVVKRFSMYRFHLQDPVYFEKKLTMTVQLLGWRSEHRYLPLQSSDVMSVAYFYLDRTSTNRRPFPDKNGLEII